MDNCKYDDVDVNLVRQYLHELCSSSTRPTKDDVDDDCVDVNLVRQYLHELCSLSTRPTKEG